MPIYMKITQNGLPVITGDVTARGHEKWIELSTVAISTGRTFAPPDGTTGQKEAGKPVFRELAISKMPDSASRPLMMAAMTGPTGDWKVQIDFVRFSPQQGESTYSSWTLEHAVITDYRIGGYASGMVQEQCRLNFTKATTTTSGVDISPNPGWKPLHP